MKYILGLKAMRDSIIISNCHMMFDNIESRERAIASLGFCQKYDISFSCIDDRGESVWFKKASDIVFYMTYETGT